ncbi:MAG: hypothetical protein U0R50_04895 [Gaiellales bacterium]
MGRGSAVGTVVFGLLAAAAMPVAIVATRWSSRYDLVQSAFAIPVTVALALVALSFSASAERAAGRSLSAAPGAGVRVGRVLAGLGLALAASGLVAIAVFGILKYLESH